MWFLCLGRTAITGAYFLEDSPNPLCVIILILSRTFKLASDWQMYCTMEWCSLVSNLRLKIPWKILLWLSSGLSSHYIWSRTIWISWMLLVTNNRLVQIHKNTFPIPFVRPASPNWRKTDKLRRDWIWLYRVLGMFHSDNLRIWREIIKLLVFPIWSCQHNKKMLMFFFSEVDVDINDILLVPCWLLWGRLVTARRQLRLVATAWSQLDNW